MTCLLAEVSVIVKARRVSITILLHLANWLMTNGGVVRFGSALEHLQSPRRLAQLHCSPGCCVRADVAKQCNAGLSSAERQLLADGLAEVHAAGVLHRDLGPRILMSAADGSLRIVNFSAAMENASPSNLALEMRGFVRMIGLPEPSGLPKQPHPGPWAVHPQLPRLMPEAA